MSKEIAMKRWNLQKLIILIQLALSPVIGGVIVYLRNWETLKPSRVFNISADIIGMLILLILFFICVKDKNDNTFQTGCFAFLVSLNSHALFYDLCCWCVDEIPSLILLNKIINTVYFGIGTATALMFWHYLVELADADSNYKGLKIFTWILDIGAAVSYIALIGNLKWHYYFDVDETGLYSRGDYFLASQIYLLVMFILFILLIIQIDMSKQKKLALSSFVSIPVIGVILQGVIYGVSLVYIGMVLALIVIYGNVFAERNRELAEKKLEISEKERDILIAKQERQRLETELDLASEIQTHILPMTFPAFPEYDEFSLYATMHPAKEVGGDFFDFFLIDENHIGLVIADVSGKGIPAALYMMIAKTILKNTALQGLSPKNVLETVNHQLCEGSDDVEMFVTVWFGVLDIRNGKMIAANAGHEYPAIRHKDGKYEFFKDPHGLVLGGMDGVKYKEYELNLEEGSALFVYTDGVSEASDIDNKQFGMDNIKAALNTEPDASPEKIIANVAEEIKKFTGDAEQFDDITMLSFRLDKFKK